MQHDRLLFRGPSFHQILGQQQQNVRQLVDRVPDATILEGNSEALAQAILAELTGPIPVIDEQNISTKTTDQVERLEDYGRQLTRTASFLEVYVPFSGDAQAFAIQPSQTQLVSTRASVSGNEVSFSVPLSGRTKEQVERDVDDYVAYIKVHLDRLRSEQETIFKAPLLNTIRQLISERHKRLQERNSLASSLKYKPRQS